MSETDLIIKLLRMEVEALRSVLSEYDQDHNHFNQYLKANAIAELLNYMKGGEK